MYPTEMTPCNLSCAASTFSRMRLSYPSMSLLRSIENGVTVSTEIELAETREPQYMSENHWRDLYQAAVFEVDPENVGARATAAEIAINTHVFEDYQHLSR